MLINISELINEKGEARHRSNMGGYGITYLGNFDEVLCSECVNSWTVEGIRENVIGGFIHWEGEALECEGCGCQVESEYGMDEAQ